MEIVWQEKDGEREMELWEGGERVCALKDVADERRIERMVHHDCAVSNVMRIVADYQREVEGMSTRRAMFEIQEAVDDMV